MHAFTCIIFYNHSTYTNLIHPITCLTTTYLSWLRPMHWIYQDLSEITVLGCQITHLSMMKVSNKDYFVVLECTHSQVTVLVKT